MKKLRPIYDLFREAHPTEHLNVNKETMLALCRFVDTQRALDRAQWRLERERVRQMFLKAHDVLDFGLGISRPPPDPADPGDERNYLPGEEVEFEPEHTE